MPRPDGVVLIHPDRLVVEISGAPPLPVTLAEVGLRDVGTRSSVSEGRNPPHRGTHTTILELR
jgi:hypothetical protein